MFPRRGIEGVRLCGMSTAGSGGVSSLLHVLHVLHVPPQSELPCCQRARLCNALLNHLYETSGRLPAAYLKQQQK